MKVKERFIYWLPTYAPKDMTIDGEHKVRPSIVLKAFSTLLANQSTYLVLQFNTTLLKGIPHIKVEDCFEKQQKTKYAYHGFIMPINVRIAVKTEFYLDKRNFYVKDKISVDKHNWLLKEYKKLSTYSGRTSLIELAKSSALPLLNSKQLPKFKNWVQFNGPERKSKGYSKIDYSIVGAKECTVEKAAKKLNVPIDDSIKKI